MSHLAADTSRNQLLQMMSFADWDVVGPNLTRVPVSLRQPFEIAGERIDFVYFVEYGLASVVARLPNGHRNEVGLVGFEGMTGGAVVLGDTQSPFDCFAQMEGTSLRITAAKLKTALSKRPSLKRLLANFARSLSIQTACTALTNGQSHVDQRLARWLLMVHDRVPGDEFSITHEDLSIMLGVRRTGVTDAMHLLEGLHLVVSTRNNVVIKDRSGLIAQSRGAYGLAEREYTRITGNKLAKSDVTPF